MESRKPPARERLLAAAAELTYARGITATGVDAIAQRAGVTKRTLYQHFSSKAELVAASLTWRDGPAIEALRSAALRRADREGVAPILALFDAIQAVLTGSGARGCAFLNASLELEDAAHPAVRSALHHLEARRQLVADLVAASEVEPDGELVDELVLLIDGSFAVAASRRDPSAVSHAREAAARLVDHVRNQGNHEET
jgi:AcrR family transcriptional regulator